MRLYIEIDGQPAANQNLPVTSFSTFDRMKRSAQALGAFLLAALLSVLIPVLHFVLVPVLTLVAFVMAFFRFRELASVDISTFKCPSCGAAAPETRLSFSKSDLARHLFCPGCRKPLRFELIEGSKASP